MRLQSYDLPDGFDKGKIIRQSWYSTNDCIALFKATNVNRALDVVVNSGLFAHFGLSMRQQANAHPEQQVFYAAYELCIGEIHCKIVIMCKATEDARSSRFQWYLLQPEEAWIQMVYLAGGMNLVHELGMDTYDHIDPDTGEVTVKRYPFKLA